MLWPRTRPEIVSWLYSIFALKLVATKQMPAQVTENTSFLEVNSHNMYYMGAQTSSQSRAHLSIELV